MAMSVAGCGLSVFPIEAGAPPGDERDAGGLPPEEDPRGGAGGSSSAPGTGGASGSRDAGRPPSGDARASADGAGGSAADAAAPMPSGPPGAGVVIGGKMIPRDKAIVYLHFGHSNMAGRTNVPAELRPHYFETHPQLWSYGKGGAWKVAKEPMSGDYLTARDDAGPGMAILRAGLAAAPDAHHISIGHGHDGSIGGWCRNYRRGALLYDYIMGPAIELKGKVTFGAMFVMLGVNEFRRDNNNLPRFNECLEGIASDMRGDLGDPNIPFLLGDWEAGATGAFDPRQPYAATTKMEMREALMNIPRSGLIASEGLPMADDHHYDLVGYKMWVERGFQIMSEKQLIPWAAAD